MTSVQVAARLRHLTRLVLVVALSGIFVAIAIQPSNSDSGEGAVMATARSQRLLSLGIQHSCVVTDAGTVQCWGDNDAGQLGTNDRLTSTTPRYVSGLSSVLEIASGNGHSCALINGGTVKCWGLDGSGQLGNDPLLADAQLPVNVAGLTGVRAISAGGFHTCALITGGTVKCWGQDGSGQLGDGVPGDFATGAQPVVGLPVGDPVTAISGGESHTCAVTQSKQLWCWGANGSGQLGDNADLTDLTNHDNDASSVPVQVVDPVDFDDPLTDVLAVSAGGTHSCAILDRPNRPTYCWGGNAFGQLGHATPIGDSDPSNDPDTTMTPSSKPLLVQVDTDPTPTGTSLVPMTMATAVTTGMEHTCAVTGPSGTVRCWGHNGAGQLGFDIATFPDDKHPTDSTYAGEASVGTAKAVVAGGFHTCATKAGETHCWGYNFLGQLGGYDEQVETPTTVTAVRGAAEVAVANHAACVRVSDIPGNQTTLQCWGSNANGRLGIGSTSPPSTTVRRPVLAGFPTTATDLRAGNGTFCAVPASGDRRCWGLNGSGEVGDATTTDPTASVTSTHLAGATAYDLGGTLNGTERGTVCKVSSGEARCFGYNGEGQLGDGTTTSSLTPVTVVYDSDPDEDDVNLVPLTGVTAVAVGGDHACAIAGGVVWCWGANNTGQLGDNTTDARVGAVKVQNDDDDEDDTPLSASAIAAGNSHTCAVTGVEKKVHCWGATGSGRLGRPGAGQHANEPVDAPGGDLVLVTDIVAGDNHTCVVQAGQPADPQNQTMLCWGANNENQLGVAVGPSAGSAQVVLQTPDPDDGDLPGDWIKDVGASRDNTCAVLLDTTVSCWGDNSEGQVGDGIGVSSLAPIKVEAGGATYDTNQIPLPPDLEVTTSPSTPVDIVVPLATIDPDGTPVTIVSVADPNLGTATFASGTITYTPDPGCQDDTFGYVVSDGTAQVAATITVRMNCAPIAVADAATTAEDTSVDIAVLTNDSDPDGDSLTIDPAFPVTPSHGSVSVIAGKVRYAPTANYCGPDTFTYRISDGNAHQATAAVNVTVTCGQDGPTAANDAVSTPEDTLLVVGAALLANDGDVDGDSLTIIAVGPAAHGSTSLVGGNIRYQPAVDYVGPDQFTYTVSDGTASATATVHVSVLGTADSPRANPDSKTVVEDGTALVDVKANDTDPDGDVLTVTNVSTASHGTAVLESGQARYTPSANYCGQDTFTYTVSDGSATAVGTVTITVTCVNDAPVTANDSATTNEDVTVHVHVLDNDIDPDGSPLHVGAISDPLHGTAVLAGGTAVAYTPDPNYFGSDSFTYEAVDPSGTKTVAPVTITVLPVDDPIALAPIPDQTTPWGNGVAVPMSVTDVDAEPVTYSVVSGPSGATAGSGAFSWTPTAVQVGVHTIKVRASSGGANADRNFLVTVTKRATALTYDGSTSGQVSDPAPVHAVLRDALTNAPVAGRSVGFLLGSASASGITDAGGGAGALIPVTGSPRTAALQTSFAGDSAYTSATAPASFLVAREGFSVGLGGTQLVTTTGTTATVTYTADLAEESDGTFVGSLSGTPVTFKRLDGTTVCTASASETGPGRARASCSASQPVGPLPVVVSASNAAYAGLASVGVATVAKTGTGFASGAGSVQGDAFGFQAQPAPRKGVPSGKLVHVVVSGPTAQVVSGALSTFTSGCTTKPKVCSATVTASSATVTTVNLSTGAPSAGGTAALRIDATQPNKVALASSGSVVRTIGTPAAQVVLDMGAVLVGG